MISKKDGAAPAPFSVICHSLNGEVFTAPAVEFLKRIQKDPATYNMLLANYKKMVEKKEAKCKNMHMDFKFSSKVEAASFDDLE